MEEAGDAEGDEMVVVGRTIERGLEIGEWEGIGGVWGGWGGWGRIERGQGKREEERGRARREKKEKGGVRVG